MRPILDQPFLIVLIAAALLGAATVLGQFCAARDPVAGGENPLAPIQGATLGLAGLLIAFSFSMALHRYEQRRTLVVEKANAIGTTALRASLLPAPFGDAATPLLRRYVAVRLAYFAAGTAPAAIAAAEAGAARLQGRLWQLAEHAAGPAPNAITASFVRSLNQMIDLEAERDAARRNRLPPVVWAGLLVVTLGASFFTGSSLRGRHPLALATLPLILALVLGMIGELDTPRGGLVQISQHSMVRLQAGLAAGRAGPLRSPPP
ncbi:MAG TPA: hypothetical protein VMU82_19085 [Acetobacteraceae bacterium]|nr:hypothetical protein [Acetobacteraceae bacterium]